MVRGDKMTGYVNGEFLSSCINQTEYALPFDGTLHDDCRLFLPGVVQDNCIATAGSAGKSGKMKFPGIVTHALAITIFIRVIAGLCQSDDQ